MTNRPVHDRFLTSDVVTTNDKGQGT
eukprot:SAG11_NODE_17071_length_529_cov_1.300000_1_plen_25_part_01